MLSKQFMYFLRSFPLTRAESLAASFTSLFFVNEQKAVIFNHFSFKTSAIISISWGKVNFVIQTKKSEGRIKQVSQENSKAKQAASDVASPAL